MVVCITIVALYHHLDAVRFLDRSVASYDKKAFCAYHGLAFEVTKQWKTITTVRPPVQ